MNSLTGYTPLNHVLTPRYKAVQVSLQQMRSILSAVYDVTIAYSNTQNTETNERVAAPGMIGIVKCDHDNKVLKYKKVDTKAELDISEINIMVRK